MHAFSYFGILWGMNRTNPEFNPWAKGNICHVTKFKRLRDIISDAALLSPIEQAKKESKSLNPGTPYHPKDNLWVKFLKFESDDPRENFSVLDDHFSHFWMEDLGDDDDIIDRPVIFIANNVDTIPMYPYSSPYVGIPDRLYLTKIPLIMVPTKPILSPYNAGWISNEMLLGEIGKLVLDSLDKGTLHPDLSIVDHFGQKIWPVVSTTRLL